MTFQGLSMTHFPERKKERRKPDLINATTAFFFLGGGGGRWEGGAVSINLSILLKYT